MPCCTYVEVWKIGVMIAPVEGSGSWPAWMQSVAKPMVTSRASEILEHALAQVAFEAVGEHRDDDAARPQLPRDGQRRVRGRPGGAADQEPVLARPLTHGGEGVVVADRAHLVDQRAVERLGPERVADALDLVRAGRAAAPDRPLRLDEHRVHPRVALLEVARDSGE